MKKEDLIIKWLDNSLDEKEQKAFEQLDASSSFKKLDAALQHFKAPAFDVENQFQKLQAAKAANNQAFPIRRLVGSIAAIFIVAIGLYFAYFNNSNDTFLAQNSEQTTLYLPDNSLVILNAGSKLLYDKSHWDENRSVALEGEAFFKVNKGSAFTVKTAQGKVSVLGTEFDVKARQDYFEVFCFEGLVSVEYQSTNTKLPAGHGFKAFLDKTIEETTLRSKPDWLEQHSAFKSVPFFEIANELERQYDIELTYDAALKNILLTTSFPHKNLDAALQAITIPLKLSYQINGNQVVLKSQK